LNAGKQFLMELLMRGAFQQSIDSYSSRQNMDLKFEVELFNVVCTTSKNKSTLWPTLDFNFGQVQIDAIH
jgi:hypothetical protein